MIWSKDQQTVHIRGYWIRDEQLVVGWVGVARLGSRPAVIDAVPDPKIIHYVVTAVVGHGSCAAHGSNSDRVRLSNTSRPPYVSDRSGQRFAHHWAYSEIDMNELDTPDEKPRFVELQRARDGRPVGCADIDFSDEILKL